MLLHLLPARTAAAAENMAADFLLLQRYPEASMPRFRHYGWRRASFTFGYAQKIAWVRSQLPPGEVFDLCRRPTGGGIVDHREDWTYALVIPRGHPLEEVRATQSYRAIHEALADALRAQGVRAVTKQVLEGVSLPDVGGVPSQSLSVSNGTPREGFSGVCFQQAELYDVIDEKSGAKIAGAAQKRNKHGLLFQGSVWRPACGKHVDWDEFEEAFTTRLAAALGVPAQRVPWPEFNEDELSGLSEQYSSTDWVEYR